jgi:hypothetical protein
LSKEVFEMIRFGAKKDVVFANIESFLNKRKEKGSGPEIIVQFIEMDENQHELEEYKEYWWARGATVKVRNKLSWGGKFDTPMDIPDDDRIACPWALTMMHVFWDGRVPRCPGDTEGDVNEEAGNAWHDSLTNLWANLSPYREKHLLHQFSELPERCHTCSDWMVGIAERTRPDRTKVDAIITEWD